MRCYVAPDTVPGAPCGRPGVSGRAAVRAGFGPRCASVLIDAPL